MEKLQVRVYSADHGYGDMKTSTGVIFPTDVVRSVPNAFGAPRSPLDQIVYSDKQGEYFVGDMARMIIESKPDSVSVNEKLGRYYFRTHEYKVAMLAGIAASYSEAEVIRINVFVTGLPSAYWEDDHEELQSLFEGMHEFTITIGTETREMKIKIDTAYVIPQPYGTLCFFAYDEQGDERNPMMLDEYVATADFGFNTTDLQLTYKGTTIPGKLESLVNKEETIGATYNTLKEIIFRDTGVPIPVQLMRRHVQKGTLNYFQGGRPKKYDLKTLAHSEFTKTANRVKEKALALWSNYSLEYVILTGGGANVTEIVDSFRETYQEFLMTPSDEGVDPVFANTFGYYRFGMNVYRYSGAFDTGVDAAPEASVQG